MSETPHTALALCLTLLALPAVRADEGMWLLNAPPAEALKARYHFEPSPAWLEHLQKSSVRFNSGGSGSFVSADGLVMTNHHVASNCLQKMSSAGTDYVNAGFLAASRAAEPQCPDLELNVLMSMEDVTGRVEDAVRSAPSGQAERARRAAINTIEKESVDRTGLRSDVVALYGGNRYHLYRYKKYTDVRLVFAPEKAAAFFGGDPDNFEYPRYDLDITFFRAYENGQPARVEHHLKWNPRGAAEGDLVFVSGHPASTSRLDTYAHLQYRRDVALPASLDMLRRREVLLSSWSARSAENARRAQQALFGIQNSRKRNLGALAGLQDPVLMGRKRAAEEELRRKVAADAALAARYGGAWDEIAQALADSRRLQREVSLLETGQGFNSQLFGIARNLLRMAEETQKPNRERLRQYSDAALPSLRQRVFSPAPIYADLETLTLGESLSMLAERLGADSELVTKILAGKSPQDRAAELVSGTRLAAVEYRRQLAAGSLEAIQASDDPMIRLARLVDGPARQARAANEQVQERLTQAYSKISAARFAIQGEQIAPDATFSLRLSFGPVKGYGENGTRIPALTTFAGAYARSADHANRNPFDLPQRWLDRKARVRLETPLNFVSTADIIGGNSGSPVVDRNGALVGIIFDGNIESLVLDYIYEDERARAVSVHAAGILEALRNLYDAGGLVDEILM